MASYPDGRVPVPEAVRDVFVLVGVKWMVAFFRPLSCEFLGRSLLPSPKLTGVVSPLALKAQSVVAQNGRLGSSHQREVSH